MRTPKSGTPNFRKLPTAKREEKEHGLTGRSSIFFPLAQAAAGAAMVLRAMLGCQKGTEDQGIIISIGLGFWGPLYYIYMFYHNLVENVDF